MKIWEEEFLNIRNFLIFLSDILSWAYDFAFSEVYSWKELYVIYKCTFILYFEKGNKYISTYKSQCFTEVYDVMLGHTHRSANNLKKKLINSITIMKYYWHLKLTSETFYILIYDWKHCNRYLLWMYSHCIFRHNHWKYLCDAKKLLY